MQRLRRRTVAHALPILLVLSTVTAVAAPTFASGVRAHRAARKPLATSQPIVRQRHPQGCGAALLATLLERYGLPGDEDALLAAAPPGPDGIPLATFEQLAARFGLVGRWRRSHARSLPEPGFVAHLRHPDGHFVFVDQQAGPYLHVLDPASGSAVWHVDAFQRRWSGRFLRLEALACAACPL